MVLCMLLVAAMLVATTTADTAEMKKGGLLGNSYASQVRQINDTTLRITTRKKVEGDLDEVNKPGTTMYNALVGVQNGASARAAIEAKNLGYDVFLPSDGTAHVNPKKEAVTIDQLAPYCFSVLRPGDPVEGIFPTTTILSQELNSLAGLIQPVVIHPAILRRRSITHFVMLSAVSKNRTNKGQYAKK